MLLPRVSVIVPSFNHGRFLERAICSVLDQGYGNAELHVIDGGSDDDTLALLAVYHHELASWSTGWDSGPAEAINAGLRRATGDLVVILSADDVLLPGALHALAEEHEKFPGAAWFVADGERLDEHDAPLGRAFHDTPRQLNTLLTQEQGPPPLSCCAFRVESIACLVGVDASLRHAFGDDLVCRLLDQGLKPRRLPVALAGLREPAAGVSVNHSLLAGREHLELCRTYADRLPPAQRFALWQACEQKRRVYALAEADAHRNAPRAWLWRQALRHPWWLADDEYRQRLLHGLPNAAIEQRKAA